MEQKQVLERVSKLDRSCCSRPCFAVWQIVLHDAGATDWCRTIRPMVGALDNVHSGGGWLVDRRTDSPGR
ncbi:hypothetical protein ACFVDQ_30625 [Streptomyces sp. NPDC057684]|uniref:hypothetical protein n=1 Tax=unclassified Streptomyces TaxID=2593676 RepID=UPI00368E05EF